MLAAMARSLPDGTVITRFQPDRHSNSRPVTTARYGRTPFRLWQTHHDGAREQKLSVGHRTRRSGLILKRAVSFSGTDRAYLQSLRKDGKLWLRKRRTLRRGHVAALSPSLSSSMPRPDIPRLSVAGFTLNIGNRESSDPSPRLRMRLVGTRAVHSG